VESLEGKCLNEQSAVPLDYRRCHPLWPTLTFSLASGIIDIRDLLLFRKECVRDIFLIYSMVFVM